MPLLDYENPKTSGRHTRWLACAAFAFGAVALLLDVMIYSGALAHLGGSGDRVITAALASLMLAIAGITVARSTRSVTRTHSHSGLLGVGMLFCGAALVLLAIWVAMFFLGLPNC
jgi:hypothetical protein